MAIAPIPRLTKVEMVNRYRLEHPNYNRDRLRKVRQLVLKTFGGKCARCGYDDWRALQIDHINGGGHAERKNSGGSESYYRRILKGEKSGKYQLLCANCNWIKRYERGEN
jgi:5-methylcytosine-specific restriction endonuclease McrA